MTTPGTGRCSVRYRYRTPVYQTFMRAVCKNDP
jgi:hypothetical protein